MGRGEREPGYRGDDGFKGRAVRRINDNHRDPAGPENDPYRELRDDDGDLPDPIRDEYIWPTIEEEEDD